MSIRTRFIVVSSVSGLTGISAIFLPFTWSTSPMAAACSGHDDIWRLGAPFFLSIPILAALLHWIISGSLSKLEQWIAYILSIAITCLTFSLFQNLSSSFVLAPFLTLAIGFSLVIRNIRAGTIKQFSSIMAMQTAYLCNCILCLIAFHEDLEIGAYCALITAVLYIVHIIMISVKIDPQEIVKDMER